MRRVRPSLVLLLGLTAAAPAGAADDPDHAERVRRALHPPPPVVAPPRRPVGAGTGFFVAEDGWVLTNSHVVRGCAAVSIETPAGREEQVSPGPASPQRDLALLRAPSPPPAVARFRPAATPATGPDGHGPGTPVALVGYPTNGLPMVRPHYDPGRLVGPTSENGHRLAVEAEVRPGNSGGPLLDTTGAVIGVIVSAVDTPATLRETGRLVRDLGFAIDGETVLDFLTSHGITPRQAETGARLDDATLFSRGRDIVVRVVCWR